jgi:leader peptidase (prepilin peptidase)/N-methyltransferase
MLLRRYGLIRPSFLDADNAVQVAPDSPDSPRTGQAKTKIVAVAFTKAHGVNPRKEILLEVLYLTPALVLAAGAYMVMTRWPVAREGWGWLSHPSGGTMGVHVNGLLSALNGFLIGGLWVWGTRILGTLAFGKEAMGMGDVDLLAAVGAVTGWIVPSMTFFVAPFLGLLWALMVLVWRRQRELPYGPWLAAGALVVMLFYDSWASFLKPYARTLSLLVR